MTRMSRRPVEALTPTPPAGGPPPMAPARQQPAESMVGFYFDRARREGNGSDLTDAQLADAIRTELADPDTVPHPDDWIRSRGYRSAALEAGQAPAEPPPAPVRPRMPVEALQSGALPAGGDDYGAGDPMRDRRRHNDGGPFSVTLPAGAQW